MWICTRQIVPPGLLGTDDMSPGLARLHRVSPVEQKSPVHEKTRHHSQKGFTIILANDIAATGLVPAFIHRLKVATDLVPSFVHHLKVGADVLLVGLGRDAGGDDASTAGVDVQQVVVTCRDLGLAVLWQNTGVVSIIT